MVRDANAKITVEEANEIAQELTGGQVSVVKVGICIQLQRKGFSLAEELHPEFDLTIAGIERALVGWQDWTDIEPDQF